MHTTFNWQSKYFDWAVIQSTQLPIDNQNISTEPVMQSTQLPIDNQNISTEPVTTMVSVLPHDSKIGTGILVAIILLSILTLLGCSTVAICYFKKKACFHQETVIKTTDELSRKDGRNATMIHIIHWIWSYIHWRCRRNSTIRSHTPTLIRPHFRRACLQIFRK